MSGFAAKLDSFFRITERGSTPYTEIKGGVVTFLAMFYILAVNPTILSYATGPELIEQLTTATAISACISCILMGLYARFPIALAPGMGINAFVAYTIVIAMGFTYYQALLAVLFSGILFFILSLSGFRKKLISEIPLVLRLGITAGIGFFIVVIGLFNAGIIVHAEGSALKLGDLAAPGVALALMCMVVTLVLWFKKHWASILIGVAFTLVVGFIGGQLFGWETEIGGQSLIPGVGTAAVTHVVNIPDFGLMGALFSGFEDFPIVMIPAFMVSVASLLVVDMFDTTGTLLGVGQAAGIMNEDGSIEGNGKALQTDALASVIGATCGTSTTTSFIESTVGIASGAKTGLMAVVVGILFFVAMFFSPAMVMITSACTVGALFMVGLTMITAVKDVDWCNPINVATMFLTLFMMGLSGSITDGIAFGTFAYLLGMVMEKKYSEITKTVWIISIIFLAYFVVSYLIIPVI